MIQTLFSCRPHPSLSKSIGIWRSNGRWNHADMLGLEDLVEDSGELLVIVVQQAAGLGPGFLQFRECKMLCVTRISL